ncbi:hypothetical protein GCM10022247_68230 [Allokutzneria multivorans]|uniref:Uncharacterized protein n=1 Tax=Allokutzneria multivorans TaxID=1142134 RepID=A0ABP7TZF2_9PSEU
MKPSHANSRLTPKLHQNHFDRSAVVTGLGRSSHPVGVNVTVTRPCRPARTADTAGPHAIVMRRTLDNGGACPLNGLHQA